MFMFNSKGSEKESKLLGFIDSRVTRREALTTTGKAAMGVVAAAVIGGMFTQPVMAKPAVVAHINGGGTAEMQPPLAAGDTSFGMHSTLLSDGSATGHIDCVDHHGDAPGFPGNIFGDVTTWSTEGSVIVLNVPNGRLVPIPKGSGPPLEVPFTVKIQTFGGAGVGHWTLQIPYANGFTFCYELLTSGQIVYNPA